MKKSKKLLIIGTTAVFFILIFVSLLFVDIGINSKFFIKKDFNQAFQYRLTGDCDSFLDYIYRDVRWEERCQKEKSHDNEPIKEFKIKQISHKFLSDRAFLQVELTRNVGSKENYTYSANYEMKKDGFRWKIDQEIK